MRAPARLGLAALLGIGGLALILGRLESSFLYFPSREYVALPRDLGLRAEPLSLESDGGARLEGWRIRGAGWRALAYFHGNGGNISHRLERVRSLVEFLGLDVFLVDYRGYGGSTGRPTESGLYADGAAIYRAAKAAGFPPERIVLFGESLGGAVAIETALSHPCGAVILESPFLSIAAMARTYYPFIPPFLIRTRFDNEAKIGRVSVPKLIVAAEKDDVVPASHARRLFEAAAPPKSFYVIPGARHNDAYIVGGREYLEEWRKVLEGTGS